MGVTAGSGHVWELSLCPSSVLVALGSGSSSHLGSAREQGTPGSCTWGIPVTGTRVPLSCQDYQAIVDAEWNILYDKLDKIHKSGAKVVLSKLPIGDVATQYFADRDMFCAGRVPEEDLKRTMMVSSPGLEEILCSVLTPRHSQTLLSLLLPRI